MGAEPSAATWFHLDLALPVVHFGVFPNGATPLEELLGLDEEVLDCVIRGPREDEPFTFLVLESGSSGLRRGAVVSEDALADHDGSGLVAETGGLAICSLLKDPPTNQDVPMRALLREFGKSPPDLCLTTLPLLPLEHAQNPDLAVATAALAKRNGDIAKLIELNLRLDPEQSPTCSATMRHQNYALQAAYDAFFLRMCEQIQELLTR
jgi:hypothetical protein